MAGLKLVRSQGIPTIKESWQVELEDEDKIEEQRAIVENARKLSYEYAKAKADLEAQAREMAEQLRMIQQQAVDREHEQAKAKETDSTIEAEFHALADEWLSETGHLSDPVKKFMHRSHLKIIGMGEKVLPLILKEVQKMSGHWFVALGAISPENPVKPDDETSLERVANAWLEWGKEKSLI